MSVAKSLWASIQGDPKFMMRVNGWLTLAWAAMIPIAIVTGWIQSIVFVSAVSIYANMTGHWSAWQAARVEVKQEEAENLNREDVKEQVKQGYHEAKDERGE